MTFKQFFLYWILSMFLWKVGFVLLIFTYHAIVKPVWGAIGLGGAKLMGRVWGDKDLDGERDE